MTWTSDRLAREAGDAIIILLTIDHPDLAMPIRVNSSGEDVTSNGDLFLNFPFRIVLPSQTSDNRPRGQLEIDNVGREIVAAVRNISTPLTVDIELVSSNDVDTVEVSFPAFQFSQIEYNALSVTGQLSVENLFSEPFPAGTFDPARFPGLF